jgi:hypothetical protein
MATATATATAGPRRCGFCRETGHDIRNCQLHADQIDTQLINDFADNPYPIFPIYPRTILLKLAEKHGLSRQLTNQVLIEHLVRIYRHLGEQLRQTRRNQRNLENIRGTPPLPRAAPTTPNTPRSTISFHNRVLNMSNVHLPIRHVFNRFHHTTLTDDDLNELRRAFTILSEEISDELYQRELTRQPKYTVIVDSGKFESIVSGCECPVCYETQYPVLTNCDHAFCGDCIKTMSKIAHSDYISCALCRSVVTTIFVSNIETADRMVEL